MTEILSVKVPPLVSACISSCLLEVGGGYAADFLQKLVSITSDECNELSNKMLPDQSDNTSLTKDEWKKIYQIINSVIYELGPEELQTITGYALNEMASSARFIYSNVNGRYAGEYWVKNLVDT